MSKNRHVCVRVCECVCVFVYAEKGSNPSFVSILFLLILSMIFVSKHDKR